MKKQLTLIALALFTSLCVSAQQRSINIGSQSTTPVGLKLGNADAETSVIKFSLSQFSLNTVQAARGEANIANILNGTPLLEAGMPDLPKYTTSLIIPDKKEMGTLIISSKYKDYENIEIAPSKGSFSRKINPKDVPYTYGAAYTKNEFFPGKLTDLNDPYIMRDYRGQTVNFYPIQYNPVTKTVRVYYEIVAKVISIGENGKNQLEREEGAAVIDPEFNQIYSGKFLNYASAKQNISRSPQYTPVNEEGSMLIISHKNFLTTMEPFVKWKKLKGIRTEIVDVATVGTTAAAIQTYIANYYKANKNLKYVLLVGDDTEVPSSTSGGDPSDNKYGCLAGTDSYVEVFVGRFSGSTAADIATQATRTLKYEKEMKGTETYLNKGVAVASGDETDDVNCINGLITQMKGSTYSTVDKITSGSGTQLVDKINQGGVGYIPHSGHGLKTSFGSISFSTSSCAKLTNTTAWPYMFCLACDVGIFTKGTCLAEAMLRASSNGSPTGFVATQMAAISQPWYEPYDALKEQNAILTDQYQNNSKWTFGGIAMNGCAKMIDNFPKTGPNVSDTWIIFGDPSLLVFTANPTNMTISHAKSIALGATVLPVSCTEKGALISLTLDGEIIGTAYSNGGSTNVAISPALATSLSSIQVTVTAKNRIPYFGNVTISSTVSVDEQDGAEGVSVYPNPASKNLHVNLGNTAQEKEMTISMVDMLGKNRMNIPVSEGKKEMDIDCSSLANGMYYLDIRTATTHKTIKINVVK